MIKQLDFWLMMIVGVIAFGGLCSPEAKAQWFQCFSRSLVVCPQPMEYLCGPRVSLFNGKDLTGWTNAEGKEPGEGWKVQDGLIYRESSCGDLYTTKKYRNFILEFEFKIGDKGNSGVKYRSWNTTGFGLGYEYQIFDDVNIPDNPPRYRTGGLYDVYPPFSSTEPIRVGEFNQGKIVVMGDYIEHWLNGQRSVSAFIGTSDWKKRVAQSKFADVREYGTTDLGRILLQDHECPVWFKNISIVELYPVCGHDVALNPVSSCYEIENLSTENIGDHQADNYVVEDNRVNNDTDNSKVKGLPAVQNNNEIVEQPGMVTVEGVPDVAADIMMEPEVSSVPVLPNYDGMPLGVPLDPGMVGTMSGPPSVPVPVVYPQRPRWRFFPQRR